MKSSTIIFITNISETQILVDPPESIKFTVENASKFYDLSSLYKKRRNKTASR